MDSVHMILKASPAAKTTSLPTAAQFDAVRQIIECSTGCTACADACLSELCRSCEKACRDILAPVAV